MPSKHEGDRENRLNRLRQRMANEFQFAMIVAFGSLILVAVSFFAIYRLITGNILGAISNTVVLCLMGSVLALALTTRRTRLAGMLGTLVTVIGVVLSSFVLGSTAVAWSYLVLWVNFLLSSLRFALAMNLALIAVLALNSRLFDHSVEAVTFAVTAGLITAFGYIFAWRLGHQQDQLESAALRDPLTQAGNRRMMRRDVDSAIRQNAASGRAFTLMLVDLDHFKRLNDEHGHDAGDQVLRDFAASLRQHIRSGDGLYRFGGEEFVLLFPDTNEEIAERLARTLHESTSGQLTGLGGELSFSAGVAVLLDGENSDGWLRRADQALYEAKSTGRNRIVAAAMA